MDDAMFWILVFPVLVVAIFYYLGFLTIGSRFVVSGLKPKNRGRRTILILIGLAIVTAPLTISKARRLIAEKKADNVYEQLAALERVDLNGRLPEKFVTVGNFRHPDIQFIKSRYGMRQFPERENDRLSAAYRQYRKTEFCHKYLYKEKMAPNINISNCRDLPASIQAALKIKEPVLFFAEGTNTSLRRSNVSIGKKYEVRLITPDEDLLVEYYEEREIDDRASITNPYASGRKLDAKGKPPTIKEFIQGALDGARR